MGVFFFTCSNFGTYENDHINVHLLMWNCKLFPKIINTASLSFWRITRNSSILYIYVVIMDCETGNVYISSRKLIEYILSFQTTIGHRVISVSLKDAAVKLESTSIKGTKQEKGRVEKLKRIRGVVCLGRLWSKKILELEEIFG